MLGISKESGPSIDWELTPEDTFGTFESWGGRERVKHASERFYYFYINAWEKPPTLCLMERGIKLARILAVIAAPQELIDTCLSKHGRTQGLDRNYPIDEPLKEWLKATVINSFDPSVVKPVDNTIEEESLACGLPRFDSELPPVQTVTLRSQPAAVAEEEIAGIVSSHGFFDSRIAQDSAFINSLVNNADDLTVTDRVTGLMWQRGGLDISSLRTMLKNVEQANKDNFAGFENWRLPTLEEALSLLEKEKNSKDLYICECFYKEQAFVFTCDERKPGGVWFLDFKQGTAFWSSGTNPGGFGRLVRSV